MGRLKEISRDRLFLFPNVTTEGVYNSISQSILYYSINRKDLSNILENPLDLGSIRKARLLVHEITHFIDHISTLHGQNSLNLICNSLNAMESGTEIDYHHIIKMSNELKTYSYEKYYKQLSGIPAKGGKEKDWEFKSSIGCRFNINGEVDRTKPIIFSQFFYQKEFIGRIPLSIESLWETSAMATEVKLHLEALVELENNDEQLIEKFKFERESFTWLYNSELLTYSTAAHFVSGLLKISDIYTGLCLSKLLALISLNFPKEYVPLLKHGNYLNLPRESKKAFLTTNDPSYIFYRLVRNIQFSNENILLENGEFDVEKILKINGLPSQQDFEQRVINSMEDISKKITKTPISDDIKKWLDFGTFYFKEFGLNAYELTPLHFIEFARSNKLPLMFDEDDYDAEKNPIVTREYYIFSLEKRIQDFISACGY
ncbi:hypothetical protein BCW_B0103 (plasmid) [Bacillus cereus W]|uniref:hypothetical protein n=1 Tax=Bacillus anthracis TaxID=1392 RepID=UPI00016B6966|nr:hypothetical protein [Bacillus anthracis]EDX54277.1 hypothetical protein BCW_B0103 [Bacillus cereus W]MEB9530326.1 hypothetical protein [Bacillus anthracis]MEC0043739.1 hypothetical protein [Bacillus anthracis]